VRLACTPPETTSLALILCTSRATQACDPLILPQSCRRDLKSASHPGIPWTRTAKGELPVGVLWGPKRVMPPGVRRPYRSPLSPRLLGPNNLSPTPKRRRGSLTRTETWVPPVKSSCSRKETLGTIQDCSRWSAGSSLSRYKIKRRATNSICTRGLGCKKSRNLPKYQIYPCTSSNRKRKLLQEGLVVQVDSAQLEVLDPLTFWRTSLDLRRRRSRRTSCYQNQLSTQKGHSQAATKFLWLSPTSPAKCR